MKIFGYEIKRVTVAEAKLIKHVQNADTSQAVTQVEIDNILRQAEKTSRSIDKGIDELTGNDYRIYSVTDWHNAMRTADQPWKGGYRSNWVQLFNIFQNVVQDPHVSACITTLTDGVQSKDFYIADENGQKNDTATEAFQKKWFYKFMSFCVNAHLWGFGLAQFDRFDREEMNIECDEVNRKHVRFDLGGITKSEYDVKAWRIWDKEPYATWCVPLHYSNLGKLNTIVRWWIYKTEIARIWAKYNNLMGIPPVVVKTQVKDPIRKKNGIDMVKKWLSSRWMVIDKEDVIEGYDSKGSNSQQFFENLMRYADEQISKALLGSTMVLDSGSSRAQSETHEDNTLRVIKSLCQNIRFTVNESLLKQLRRIGFDIPQGSKFVWDNSEKLTMKERAEVVNLMNLNYKVPENTASEFVGIELEEKENNDLPAPVKGAIEDYKMRLENG